MNDIVDIRIFKLFLLSLKFTFNITYDFVPIFVQNPTVSMGKLQCTLQNKPLIDIYSVASRHMSVAFY